MSLRKEIMIECDYCENSCDWASANSMKEAERLFLGETDNDMVSSNGVSWFKINGKHCCKTCKNKLFAKQKETAEVKE